MITGLESFASEFGISPFILSILLVWTLVWKALACWKAAKLNKPIWFIVLFILNTVGILEILYIFVFSEYKIQGKGPAKKINKKKSKRKSK